MARVRIARIIPREDNRGFRLFLDNGDELMGGLSLTLDQRVDDMDHLSVVFVGMYDVTPPAYPPEFVKFLERATGKAV